MRKIGVYSVQGSWACLFPPVRCVSGGAEFFDSGDCSRPRVLNLIAFLFAGHPGIRDWFLSSSDGKKIAPSIRSC